MEANLRSRKRKQASSSDPLRGIYTRSKANIYIHHNRSGRARSDHTQLFQSKSKPISSNKEEALPINNVSHPHLSIKDLRARRVFSPATVIQYKPSNDSHPQDADFSCMGPDFIVDSSSPPHKHNHNHNHNHNVIMEDEPAAHITQQMTPSQSHPNQLVSTNYIDRSNVAISRIKSGHSSNTRHKLFKTPSSFSYRRLLPFLTDIAQNDSDISQIEMVEMGLPCKVQNSSHVNPNLLTTGDYHCAGKHEDNVPHSDDRQREPSANVGTREFASQLALKVDHMNTSPNLSQTEGIFELHNVELTSHKVDETVLDLMVDCDQMTPPDADIYSKPDVHSMGNKEENILHKGIVDRNNGSIGDQRNGFIARSKLVLNPCSRVKVFKTPSSVSYRRLLPLLMDIANDNSCGSKISQCLKHVKDLDQMPHQPKLPSSSQDVHSSKSETIGETENLHYTGDEESKLPMPILTSADVFSDETNLSSPVPIFTSTNCSSNSGSISLSAEKVSESHRTLDTQVKSTTQTDYVISESPRKLELEPLSDIVRCSVIDHENLLSEVASDISKHLSLDKETDCAVPQMGSNEVEGKPLTFSLDQNPCQSKGFDSSAINIYGLRKGILKRNTRGCRGLCNCLNCASFRLHAERAFEFSRNQMHDAEEVALELINKLAYIREVLHDTFVDPDAARVSQVKEACRKALETEELAKKRLGKMNEDLSAHCRSTSLQRPRVTFANNVEEKVIPKARSMKK